MAGQLPPAAPTPQQYNNNTEIGTNSQPHASILMVPQQMKASNNNTTLPTQTLMGPASLQILVPNIFLSSQLGLSLYMAQVFGSNHFAVPQFGNLGAAFPQSLASASTTASFPHSSTILQTTLPATPATRCSRILSNDQDEHNLSPYQGLVRQQIELFQATQTDLHDKSQGRNKPIILKQIGIRYKHCGIKPAQERAKGAVFFPSQLVGLYQTAQNIANKHLLEECLEMPKFVRENLNHIRLREKGSKTRKSAYGGGRHYWADCLRVLGVEETVDRRLRFTQKKS